MMGIYTLLIIAIVIGAVLGWVSFFRIGELKDKIEALREYLLYLRSRNLSSDN